ncbi:unnamed protein product [Kuraishia capsulata CBS 1993]|uniref:37S ribosomal protein S35, mitochondrial n=1 Tax=Kuraishia capsulata CBS 1993 TaxID=1382522 RepID=W6MPE9_9ASCO|nr:uncharacterized protein KUCA_T00004547001 [Kuraishia capsulata CBS 1993]CDK28564.1 unnamed protein product [Kuraishia capsulata CBS 1993]
MLSRQSLGSRGNAAVNLIQQSRGRKSMAYPQYGYKARIENPGGSTSQFRLLLKEFLGPKNFRGDYHFNKYYYAKQDHTTNYLSAPSEDGSLTRPIYGHVRDDAVTQNRPNANRNLQLTPFRLNADCKTNTMVSEEMKTEIVNQIDKGVSERDIAIKYGLKLPRIEAIYKLRAIEKEWEEKNLITKDIKTMSTTMYKMFPLHDPVGLKENLSEIPVPVKTLKARFLTIAESEPFGPIEAAESLELEPATETLAKLMEHREEKKTKKQKAFMAPVLDGERVAFRFTEAKVGDVGFRYGAPLRDTKKDRKIEYDANGKMVYGI